MGVGIFAGSPYYCAEGGKIRAFATCGFGIGLDIDKLIGYTKDFEKKGLIDPLSSLENTRIYLFSGLLDSVVYPAVMQDVETYYRNFTQNVKTTFSIAAEHAFPTDNYGNSCDYLGGPGINNCHFDGAGDALNWFYGTLNPKGQADPNNFMKLNQTEFVPEGYTLSSLSLNDYAIMYVPKSCRDDMKNTTCSLHVSFHGCGQTTVDLNDIYYSHIGFNEWAETNNIVVLYPQTAPVWFNMRSCWDFWGYSSVDYAFNIAPQMLTIRNMIHSLYD